MHYFSKNIIFLLLFILVTRAFFNLSAQKRQASDHINPKIMNPLNSSQWCYPSSQWEPLSWLCFYSLPPPIPPLLFSTLLCAHNLLQLQDLLGVGISKRILRVSSVGTYRSLRARFPLHYAIAIVHQPCQSRNAFIFLQSMKACRPFFLNGQLYTYHDILFI